MNLFFPAYWPIQCPNGVHSCSNELPSPKNLLLSYSPLARCQRSAPAWVSRLSPCFLCRDATTLRVAAQIPKQLAALLLAALLLADSPVAQTCKF